MITFTRITTPTILIALLLAAPFASAQTRADRIPTNVPGVSTALEPPPGFDPVAASDAELDTFGFPPRPDAQTAPEAYTAWQAAMRAAKTRIVPELSLTNVYHGPVRGSQVEHGATSNNWSGSVALGASFLWITAEYVVPVAEHAFGSCSNPPEVYSSTWIGIDGYSSATSAGSNDVLQAGTESDHGCPFPGASYYAWAEWFPLGEMQINNFAVNPGDDMYVVVWSPAPNLGNVFIANKQTNQATTLILAPPQGTTLVGNSAEWILERPTVGGSLSTLANYISDYFSNCSARTAANQVYVPGSPGAIQLTMLDNNNNPISFPTLLGPNAIWLQDEGSAL